MQDLDADRIRPYRPIAPVRPTNSGRPVHIQTERKARSSFSSLSCPFLEFRRRAWHDPCPLQFSRVWHCSSCLLSIEMVDLIQFNLLLRNENCELAPKRDPT